MATNKTDSEKQRREESREAMDNLLIEEGKLKAYVSHDIICGVMTTPARAKKYFKEFEEAPDRWESKDVLSVFRGKHHSANPKDRREIVMSAEFLKRMLKHLNKKDQVRLIFSGEELPLVIQTKKDSMAIGPVVDCCEV